jgi:hypothetical protein
LKVQFSWNSFHEICSSASKYWTITLLIAFKVIYPCSGIWAILVSDSNLFKEEFQNILMSLYCDKVKNSVFSLVSSLVVRCCAELEGICNALSWVILRAESSFARLLFKDCISISLFRFVLRLDVRTKVATPSNPCWCSKGTVSKFLFAP